MDFFIKWFLDFTLLAQILIIYLIIINIATFFYFGLDKMKASLAHKRISEKKLWTLSMVGGSLGGILGMHFFRHKTQKLSFQIIMAIILSVQICLVIWILM
ncbi:MAG: DUF1294 domain-containing protein [Candidatus Magasanikbacteria bacterium CG_4_9_14_3_um_filter_32_9]|uniref:DUF1294 domain-containing protein n=1 Tax=Candidatus Magasanikbacteria bacterium CG_4_9_14_3_um_filter_32_9 TaxID=1974644 RepID=A0A2M7Z7X0_9BACT|nr:MAG: DUF1294 domain-containing protein [Candidatus Magasanikbacteria bacterium CG_4_9_14_3_um_filter_32_9]